MTAGVAQQTIDASSFVPERSIRMPARRWASDEVEPPAPHPAPVVPMRDAEAGEIPSTARRLRDLAEANGWTVRATYCRGTYATRVSSRVIDSLALRMRRGGERAVAVWNDRRFDSACAWDTGLCWPRPLNVAELRALVETADVEVSV